MVGLTAMDMPTDIQDLEFRPATDADRDGIIALLDTIYGEYGERLCFEGCDADLLDIAAQYPDDGFAVLERDGVVVATVAVSLSAGDEDVVWLKRLYLDESLRGTGWGLRLVAWALDRTRAAGRRRLQCWSDIRFERAHRFYRKIGFVDTGEVRRMTDSHEPYREYFFYRDLEPE